MNVKLGVVFLAACLATCPVQGQSLFGGSCPTVSVVSPFNSTAYGGTWYENRKYFAIFEAGQRCVTATYTPNADGSVQVLNRAVLIFIGKQVSVTGVAKQLEPPSAKLGVTFSNVPGSPSNSPYWVLGTDYKTYSVVWSCNNYGFFNSQIAWILTRDRSPAQSVIDTAIQVLNSNGINTNLLKLTDQSNCPSV